MNGKRNSSAYNRDMTWRKAIRKRRIAKNIYRNWSPNSTWEYYDNLHQYPKIKFIALAPPVKRKLAIKVSEDIGVEIICVI